MRTDKIKNEHNFSSDINPTLYTRMCTVCNNSKDNKNKYIILDSQSDTKCKQLSHNKGI